MDTLAFFEEDDEDTDVMIVVDRSKNPNIQMEKDLPMVTGRYSRQQVVFKS
jgi:hypothetical protein